jgi:pimeloyl-ACP methyl ester carboxylesterase
LFFLHGGPGFSNYLEPFFKNIDPSVNAILYDQLKGETVSIDGLVDQLDSYINSLETFHSLYDGYISSHDLTDKFSKLKLPILSISGSEDVRFCPRIAKSLVNYNPKVELFELVGAGHFPSLFDSHRKIVFDKILCYTKILMLPHMAGQGFR